MWRNHAFNNELSSSRVSTEQGRSLASARETPNIQRFNQKRKFCFGKQATHSPTGSARALWVEMKTHVNMQMVALLYSLKSCNDYIPGAAFGTCVWCLQGGIRKGRLNRLRQILFGVVCDSVLCHSEGNS